MATQLLEVPASTIHQHRQEPSINSRVGRPNYLNCEAETYFVSILQLFIEYDFSVAPDVALQLAAEYFKSLKLPHRPSEKWLCLFMKRHRDDVKWLRQQKMKHERAAEFTEEVLIGWFSTLKEVMTK